MKLQVIKSQLVIWLLVLYSLPSFSQDKAMLTKEETINYLSKKAKECEGHYRYNESLNRIMYYLHLSVTLNEDNMEIFITSANKNSNNGDWDYFEVVRTQRFNPAHIVSITNSTSNKDEPLGYIAVTLNSKSCVYSYKLNAYKEEINNKGYNWHQHSEGRESLSEVGFVYLNSDPANFNKIKKALEHLIDLYKAEDDPFGN